MKKESIDLAVLADPKGGGGITKFVLSLLSGLDQAGVSMHLILCQSSGRPYLQKIPKRVRIVDFDLPIESRTVDALKLILPLYNYLLKNQPSYLLSSLALINYAAVIATCLPGVKTSLILVEHNPIFRYGKAHSPIIRLAMRYLYPMAKKVIAVSHEMALGLEKEINIPKQCLQVIYNPVVTPELLSASEAEVNHPWFDKNSDKIPVFLAVGRLTKQKDFSTLIKGFKIFRDQQPAKLLILGEGSERLRLAKLICELGLDQDVDMPGHVQHPLPYMCKAKALVLTSRWEGLPTVMIEALACGCNIIATSCPYGSKEILVNGRYGWLISVGDVQGLAIAMREVLETPLSSQVLKYRSHDFSFDAAIAKYLELIQFETTD